MSAQPGKRKPTGEGLLDIEGLAERWGKDVEETKRFVRLESIPFILFGKPKVDKIRWDRVLFRIEAIQRWEAESQFAYIDHRKQAPSNQETTTERSPLRGGWR